MERGEGPRRSSERRRKAAVMLSVARSKIGGDPAQQRPARTGKRPHFTQTGGGYGLRDSPEEELLGGPVDK